MAAGADEEPFSAQENSAVDQLLKIASSIDASTNTKKMTTASPLAQGKKYVANDQQSTTGYYTTKVPCGLLELHAYIEAEDNSSNFIEKIEEAYNDHHSINYYAKSLPKPASDREFHQSVITKVEDENTIVMVSVPCFIEEKVKERPIRPDRVRAAIRNMYLLVQISDIETRVDFYAEIELGGYLDGWIVNHELHNFMSAPTKWQEHFQHLRALRELTPEDGVAIGTMLTTLVENITGNNRNVGNKLSTFIEKNVALKELKETFPQLRTMILGVLRNKILHVTKKKKAVAKVGIDLGPGQATTLQLGTVTVTAGSTLRELSEKEAAKIGNSFAMILLTSTEPDLAVDAWRLENSALQPLFDEHQFFEPMMQTIAKRLLASGNLGLKLRVFLGAFLSLAIWLATRLSLSLTLRRAGPVRRMRSYPWS